jgi:ABC-2 type transport system permease protein
MFIIIYGNMVMRSVIENKSYYRNNNLIGEAISVDDGKIIGTSLAGILQFFYMGLMVFLYCCICVF